MTILRRSPGLRLQLALTALLGAVVTVTLCGLSYGWEMQRWRASLERTATERMHALSTSMHRTLEAAAQIEALTAASETVTPEELQTFSAFLLASHPEVVDIDWLRRVPGSARDAFEARQRQRHADFRIWERSKNGRRAAADRETYYVLTASARPAHAEQMRGFSPTGEHALSYLALHQAVTTDRTVLSPRLPLEGTAPRTLGTIAFRPIRSEPGGPPLGVVALVFDLRHLFEQVFGANASALPIMIHDASETPPQLLYRSISGDAERWPVALTSDLDLAGRKWRVSFLPRPLGLPVSVLLALLSGLLLTGGALSYLLGQHRRTRAIEAKVEERTQALSETNQRLAETLQGQRQTLQELADSEARYRLLADNASDMISRASPEEAVFLYVSPASTRLLGYRPEQMVGRSAYDFCHPDDVYRIRRAHERALRDPGIRTANYRMRHADGHYVWLEITHRILVDDDGRPTAIISVFRDLSEQKSAERDLRENEVLFRSAFEDAAAGMVLFDLQRRFVRVNQAFCQMVGYSRDEVRQLAVEDLTHPADQQITPGAMERLLRGEADRVRFHKRHLSKSGRTLWLAVQLALVRDHRGDPLYFISHAQDITEQKQVEAELEELRLRQELILNTASEGICGVDREGRTTFANQAAADLLGYDVQELLGRNLHGLLHHSTADGAPHSWEDCPVFRCLQDRQPHQEDTVLWHRDGSALPVRLSCNAISEREQIEGVVVTFAPR